MKYEKELKHDVEIIYKFKHVNMFEEYYKVSPDLKLLEKKFGKLEKIYPNIIESLYGFTFGNSDELFFELTPAMRALVNSIKDSDPEFTRRVVDNALAQKTELAKSDDTDMLFIMTTSDEPNCTDKRRVDLNKRLKKDKEIFSKLHSEVGDSDLYEFRRKVKDDVIKTLFLLSKLNNKYYSLVKSDFDEEVFELSNGSVKYLISEKLGWYINTEDMQKESCNYILPVFKFKDKYIYACDNLIYTLKKIKDFRMNQISFSDRIKKLKDKHVEEITFADMFLNKFSRQDSIDQLLDSFERLLDSVFSGVKVIYRELDFPGDFRFHSNSKLFERDGQYIYSIGVDRSVNLSIDELEGLLISEFIHFILYNINYSNNKNDYFKIIFQLIKNFSSAKTNIAYVPSTSSNYDKLCKLKYDSYEKMNFNEDWSSEVDSKWDSPEGLFKSGTAQEIADEVVKSHKTLKSSISSLNFYLNRGGSNIPEDRRKVIEEAKEIVRSKFNN